jgi:hypothetical protein
VPACIWHHDRQHHAHAVHQADKTPERLGLFIPIAAQPHQPLPPCLHRIHRRIARCSHLVHEGCRDLWVPQRVPGVGGAPRQTDTGRQTDGRMSSEHPDRQTDGWISSEHPDKQTQADRQTDRRMTSEHPDRQAQADRRKDGCHQSTSCTGSTAKIAVMANLPADLWLQPGRQRGRQIDGRTGRQTDKRTEGQADGQAGNGHRRNSGSGHKAVCTHTVKDNTNKPPSHKRKPQPSQPERRPQTSQPRGQTKPRGTAHLARRRHHTLWQLWQEARRGAPPAASARPVHVVPDTIVQRTAQQPAIRIGHRGLQPRGSRAAPLPSTNDAPSSSSFCRTSTPCCLS